MSSYLIEQIAGIAEIRVRTCTSVVEAFGSDHLERLTLADGERPPDWPLDRDPFFLESSVPGVFVAGDVRAESVKRVASAVGEGAMAVMLVHKYLGER